MHPSLNAVARAMRTKSSGMQGTAAKLQLPRTYLEDAIARCRGRKRVRLFKEVKLKLHWLMTRTAELIQRAKVI